MPLLLKILGAVGALAALVVVRETIRHHRTA